MPAFGASTASLFGAAQSSAPVFGAQPTPAPSMFGAPQSAAATSLFGTPQSAAASSLFGTPQTGAGQSAPAFSFNSAAGGLFGTSALAGRLGAGFGAQSQAAPSSFGLSLGLAQAPQPAAAQYHQACPAATLVQALPRPELPSRTRQLARSKRNASLHCLKVTSSLGLSLGLANALHYTAYHQTA